MSDHSSELSGYEARQCNIQQSQVVPSWTKGAPIGIYLDGMILKHVDKYGENRITFRSYKDGVRVGCTFITYDALFNIWYTHATFQPKEYVEHQAGVE